jgi:hypothetical protein
MFNIGIFLKFSPISKDLHLFYFLFETNGQDPLGKKTKT